ncbi:MAG TPA: hypothetical protein VGZ22_22970 [Isosphaeraceae bacterium]|jgi:hypothetical protein|nr:hypothetical protein [Isosphaeraceae bacterium]
MPVVDRVRLASMGLGLALALGLAFPARIATAAGQSMPAPVIPCKNRSFRIPFHVEDADRPRLKEVQLWESEDSGFTWKLAGRTTPDSPAFTFRATRDAEYWFAVRTMDNKGRLYPSADDKKFEPNMKVIVDTNPPSLIVEPQGRRGSQASVRWEVRDEHLDLASFVLEYQAEGARDWRQVPIKRPALIGEQTWDAGSADRLKVRASVADKAGNVQTVELTLPDGTAANPDLAGGPDPPDMTAPPPIEQVSSPTFPGRDEPPRDGDGPDPFGSQPTPGAPGPDAANDPFAASEPAPGPAPAAPQGGRTLLVASPRFALQYAVDDAGPNGPALVELWVTRDGGRNWSRHPEDVDRVSPYQVDLSNTGGDGTFGLSLVARSASGLGDQSPAPGDAPQMWVEVDSTPPLVQLAPVRVGSGSNAGKLAISWRATDAHLADRPIIISYRPDIPGARWQPITDRIDNSGRFIWVVPANVPPRFHLRVDAIDTLGNRGSAETTETGPVMVDRTRPRGRILGLDPSARNGPSARPLR